MGKIIGDNYLITSVLIFVVFMICFFVLEVICARKNRIIAVVIDKYFSPQETSTNVGVGIAANGSVGPMVMVNNKSDEYFILIKYKGSQMKIAITREKYLSLDIGQKVIVDIYKGRLFGIVVNTLVE